MADMETFTGAHEYDEYGVMLEDKTYSMDYDGDEEDTKGERALDSAHKHFQKQGYTISHQGSDDPNHKEHKNPDVTYHYAMGDDMHHAFTIHKNGKAANDPHVKRFTKNLEDVSENTNTVNIGKYVYEASAAETLKPGGGSGGGDTKAETLATFTSMLAQLGKEDLSKIFNDVQALYGPNKAPGAEDKSAANRATVNAKPSAAVGNGAWKEDVDAMFGNDLSEEFKERAEVVFEAALNTRLNIETVRLEEEFEAATEELAEAFAVELEERTNALMEDMTEKLDQYLDYCTEQWMEDNRLTIENSLRADIAEDFMLALRNVFVEHFITVPDGKLDLVAEMKAELDEVKAMLNETLNEKLELEKTFNEVVTEANIEAAFEDVSEGLAETQLDKLRTLAEGIDYTDAGTYRKKLEIVKEQYFNKNRTTSTGLITEVIDGEDDSDTGSTGYTAPGMDKYVSAIAKSAK